MFRGMILAAALVAAPGLAVGQQPAQTPPAPHAATPAQSQARDTTKTKPAHTATHRRRAKPRRAAHDSTMRHDSTSAKP